MVYALGGFAGIRDVQQPEAGFEGFLGKVLALSGVRQEPEVKGEGPLQWRSGLSGETRLLFAANPGEVQQVHVRWPKGDLKEVRELRSSTALPVTVDESGKQGFEFRLEEGGFLIFEIENKIM
ncbi:MAG TPA: hypothetical protein DD727_04020 [Clostridiales bacterium]|nr:hypothetical protein [Clostridiales bacterium]